MFYSHEGMHHTFLSGVLQTAYPTAHAPVSLDLAQIRCCDHLVSAIHKCVTSSSDACRLVATLGSKSALRKVNRKDIQAVDVKKACQTIIMPEAPLALRLQSNLLYSYST